MNNPPGQRQTGKKHRPAQTQTNGSLCIPKGFARLAQFNAQLSTHHDTTPWNANTARVTAQSRHRATDDPPVTTKHCCNVATHNAACRHSN